MNLTQILVITNVFGNTKKTLFSTNLN